MLSRRTIVSVVCFAAVVTISAVLAQSPTLQRELQGTKPYTPTRLEWLAVKLNAYYRYDSLREPALGFNVTFVTIENEDSILLYVQHMRDANRASMNITVNSARKIFDMEVKNRGWDSWVKLREKIEMVEEK